MERKIKDLIKEYERRIDKLTKGAKHDNGLDSQKYALENVVQDLENILKSL